MEYKVKKNNNATAELTIHFTAEELEKGFDKAYLQNKDKVKVPGFRPGKAPLERIKKILGDSVTEDAINHTLNDAIIELFPKLDPKPFRIPRFNIQDEKLDRSKGFSAVGVYDTFPEVTLPKYKKIKVDTYEIKPSDADIQKELEIIQNSLARNVLKEEGEDLQTGNLIEMKYRFCPAEEELPEEKLTGKYKIGQKENPPGFDENLIAMKVGDTKAFDFTYPAEFPQAPESAGKTYKYEITVTAAYNVNLPAIDDDMASEYDGSENLAELKNKIQDRIVAAKNEELKTFTFTDIYAKMVEEGKFVIPENLIKEEGEHVFQTMFQQYNLPPISMKEYSEKIGAPLEETQKKFQEMGLKRLQGYFLRLKIAEEEKIQVTPEEFQEKMKVMAESFGEDFDKFLKRMEKEERIPAIQDNLLMEKVDNFVYESVEKKGPKSLSLEESDKLLKRENQAA
ncbi:MAG: trigger factor [Leptospira sp.]|nr:trigger factor [Leptospira sp.]